MQDISEILLGGAPMKPVSDEEMKTAFAGPSIAADRFFITVKGGSVRIAFAERAPGTETDYFRTSVTLGPEDAVTLYKVLQELMKPFEAAIAAHNEAQKNV